MRPAKICDLQFVTENVQREDSSEGGGFFYVKAPLFKDLRNIYFTLKRCRCDTFHYIDVTMAL